MKLSENIASLDDYECVAPRKAYTSIQNIVDLLFKTFSVFIYDWTLLNIEIFSSSDRLSLQKGVNT